MKDLQKWKLLNSDWAFYHDWYKVRKDEVELPNGKVIDDYYVSVRPEVVVVFPITTKGEVILVHQYKHGAQDFILDFPGGLFNKENETALDAGIREVKEETGYEINKENTQFLGTLYDDPTKNTNKVHLFLAWDCICTSGQCLDETEDINVYTKSIEEVSEYLLDGKINVTTAIAIAHKALNYYHKNIKTTLED